MKFKIGAAVPFGIFETPVPEKAAVLSNAFDGPAGTVAAFAKAADCAELRTVRGHSDPTRVADAVQQLHDAGLTVTIHGTLDEADVFFAPYSALLKANIQDRYNVTVHPVQSFEKTVALLRDVCARIDKNGYPFFITLENQRITNEKPFGTCEDIVRVVEAVGAAPLGICFDFGHQLSNTKKGIDDPVTDAFLSRVRHTHIHSFYEGRTHFPLNCGETALDANLTALCAHGFDGVLSLELSAERFADQFAVAQSFEQSIAVLRTAAALATRKCSIAAFYRNDYLQTVQEMKIAFEQAEIAAGLLGPSAYVLKFGNTRIAVDVAPNVLGISEEAQTAVAEWLSGFDAYIVTHSHRDHFDPAFLAKLSPHLVKLIPDFLETEIPHTATHDGDSVTVGAVTVTFFSSGHQRNGGGVLEYGFCVDYQNERYVFPCDVRNYDFPFPAFENVRVLFSHVWLGKANALNACDNAYVEEFCTFVKQFDAKTCCLAHLNDIHRTIEEMWSAEHVNVVQKRLPDAVAFTVGNVLTF